MLFTFDDLSKKVERTPVKCLNRYTFDKLPEFTYIKTLRLTNDISNRFCRTTCCDCQNGECLTTDCSCYLRETIIRKYCNSFACTCSSSKSICKNLIKDMLELKTNFQVYYVNPGKKWGVRAEQDIFKNTFLFEYAGVLIPDKEFEERNDYLFYFQYEFNDYIIDAKQYGNIARFLNHSCFPNLKSQIIVADHGIPHIVFYAARNIYRGEELTIHYSSMWWDVNSNLQCLCGEKFCEYKRNDFLL